MAKKEVIWSWRAQQDRLEILEYWINRNKSKNFSEKLLKLFIQSSELISTHPQIGKPTNFKNIRFKIIFDYLLFYEESKNRIEILFIWDSRQNPDKLNKLIKDSLKG
jgi:plasmid stabilization system protein ParE